MKDKEHMKLVYKRKLFEQRLKERFDGIIFFISCATGSGTNARKNGESATKFQSGIAYFLVINKTENTNTETIFAAFHDAFDDVDVDNIKPRVKAGKDNYDVIAMLKIVIKVYFVIFLHLSLSKLSVLKLLNLLLLRDTLSLPTNQTRSI